MKKSSVAISTTLPSTTIEPERGYAPLAFVSGIKSCKNVQKGHQCKNLCLKLKKAYDKSISGPSQIPYYAAGGLLLVLSVIFLVLWVKVHELNQDHSEEMDLGGLSRREKQRTSLLDQPDPDAESWKFKKRGGVVIATNFDEAFKQKCEDENENVEMGDVEYVETDNEHYDFGDDHDKFESGTPDKSKSKSKTKSGSRKNN